MYQSRLPQNPGHTGYRVCASTPVKVLPILLRLDHSDGPAIDEEHVVRLGVLRILVQFAKVLTVPSAMPICMNATNGGMGKTMRRLALVLALAVTLSACGGGGEKESLATESPTTTVPAITTTTTVPATTTTSLSADQLRANELAADLPPIKKLWRDGSDAWTTTDALAGFRAMVEANYPTLRYSAEQCRQATAAEDGELPPAGYQEEYILDEASVERDDGWVMKFGPSGVRGTVPKGRIYIMKVTSTTDGEGVIPSSETQEVHVTILDGKAYRFVICNEADA